MSAICFLIAVVIFAVGTFGKSGTFLTLPIVTFGLMWIAAGLLVGTETVRKFRDRVGQ